MNTILISYFVHLKQPSMGEALSLSSVLILIVIMRYLIKKNRQLSKIKDLPGGDPVREITAELPGFQRHRQDYRTGLCPPGHQCDCGSPAGKRITGAGTGMLAARGEKSGSGEG